MARNEVTETRQRLRREGATEVPKQRRRFHELPDGNNDVQIGTYKAGLKIDKHDLDEELIRQPSSFSDVVDALALAKSRRDLLKDELDTLEAHLSLKIRAEKDEAGDKCTEANIKALVQVHPDRLETFREYVSAEREVVELEGLRESYRNRGFMLTELVSLHGQAYFQENSAGGSQMAKRESDAYRAREAMNQKRQERNRHR